MITWQRGSTIVTRKRQTAEGPMQAFIDQLSRRRGLCVSLARRFFSNAAARPRRWHCEQTSNTTTFFTSTS